MKYGSPNGQQNNRGRETPPVASLGIDAPLDSVVVYIAPSEEVETLKSQSGFDRDILIFGYNDSLKALEAVAARKPFLVVVHRSFLGLSRGAAIINQLRTDPNLSRPQIRVVDQSSDYISLVVRHTKNKLPANSARPGEPLPDNYRGTRSAERMTIDREVEVRLEGDQSRLINLSTTGAQLVSASATRPGQRVRVSLAPNTDDAIKLIGMVAWATFEPASGSRGPEYRLGVAFMDADAAQIAAFCERYRTR